MKYRKNVFTGDAIVDFPKIREIIETFNVDILEIECDKDYFHMLFKFNSLLNIPQLINATKTISSGEIQQNYPVVKKYLCKWKFRSPSYFPANAGSPRIS